MERVIFEQRARLREAMSFASSSDDAMLEKWGLPWKLSHCGLHLDAQKDTVDFFELKNLTVRFASRDSKALLFPLTVFTSQNFI